MKLYLLEKLDGLYWFPVGVVDDFDYVETWVAESSSPNHRRYRSYILNEVLKC